MVIKTDNRPRDWGYMATFNSKDLPSIQEMLKHIRETHDVGMIEDINDRFERKAHTLPNGIPIQSVTKTEDLATNAGLQQCINIILGTSATRFSHLGYTNNAGSSPAVTDTTLTSETANLRIAMATFGWMEASGMRLFFGGIVPSAVTTSLSTILEMGVFNASSAGVLLNRERFNSNQITRSQSSDLTMYTAAFLSSVVEFCPMA